MAFHPLTVHALDVAAVAVLLAPQGMPGLDRRTLGFLVALFGNRAMPQAFAALTAAGLAPAAAVPFGGVGVLFPGVTRSSPVQRWAETVALPPRRGA